MGEEDYGKIICSAVRYLWRHTDGGGVYLVLGLQIQIVANVWGCRFLQIQMFADVLVWAGLQLQMFTDARVRVADVNIVVNFYNLIESTTGGAANAEYREAALKKALATV